ncbi:MAG: DHH family phosphoesterase [Streptomycetales bacterium]
MRTGPPDPPREADWQGVVSLLRDAGEIYLACHVRPDGDALGSALAVGLALRSLGKRVHVSFGDDPPAVPRALSFLPGLDMLIHPSTVPDVPGIMVTFDTATVERLGLLGGKARSARTLVVVDHHESNTVFGTHHLVDPAAPATAVLVDELVRRLGVKLTPELATAVYTGLVTDTGSFRNPGTTPEIHALAGRLLETGIRGDLIGRHIWDTSRFGYLKVLADALGRASLEPAAAGGLGLVWTTVPRTDREHHDIGIDEIEGIIDVVRKTAEAEVAVVLKEDRDGVHHVSVRSKGRVDIGEVCCRLGGGGHRYAAGFTTLEDPQTIVSRLLGMLSSRNLSS